MAATAAAMMAATRAAAMMAGTRVAAATVAAEAPSSILAAAAPRETTALRIPTPVRVSVARTNGGPRDLIRSIAPAWSRGHIVSLALSCRIKARLRWLVLLEWYQSARLVRAMFCGVTATWESPAATAELPMCMLPRSAHASAIPTRFRGQTLRTHCSSRRNRF